MGAIAAIKATKKAGIQVYSVDGSPDGKAAIVDGTMTGDGVQVPIQEAEVAFKQALELLQTGKIQGGSTNIPKEDMDYYTAQWGSQHRQGDLSAVVPADQGIFREKRRQVAVTVVSIAPNRCAWAFGAAGSPAA